MSVVSRLIVVHADARITEAVRLGFARQGTQVTALSLPHEGAIVNGDPPQLVVVGAEEAAQAKALLEGLRRELEQSGQPVPILYLGNGISREQALAAGASEYLPQPAFLRDVVIVGNLMAGPRRAGAMAGELGEQFGLYFLVRALLGLRRTGVLTLVRGLRRGELRFYQGELTSAQVGILHGQAAFHQLLLWTEGRFEFRAENLVQRRQIPLDANDLLADAELFLSEIRTIAAGIPPSTVFAQDVARAAAANVPVQVAAVLGLFDGHRMLADVIEDSPYRVFETLRVTQRLAEIGAIRPAVSPRPQTPARTALAIDEWLVGDTTPAAAARGGEPAPGPRRGEPASPPRGGRRKERRKKRRGNGSESRPAVSQRADTARIEVEPTDWSSILPPSTTASDGLGMSPVVPATVVAGEIEVGERPVPQSAGAEAAVMIRDEEPEAPQRERLEELTDSDQRARIFPAEPAAPAEADPSDSAELRAAHEVVRRAIEQARAAAEAAAHAEQEARRAQEELERTKVAARRAAEEQAKRAAEEQARRAAEEQARRAAEEQARRAAEEQARRAAEEQARHAAEEQARHAAEEAKRVAEEQARRAAEEQARRAAEEQARRAAEEQAKRAAEEQAKRAAEEQAKRAAEEQAKRAAEEQARREDEEREAEEWRRAVAAAKQAAGGDEDDWKHAVAAAKQRADERDTRPMARLDAGELAAPRLPEPESRSGEIRISVPVQPTTLAMAAPSIVIAMDEEPPTAAEAPPAPPAAAEAPPASPVAAETPPAAPVAAEAPPAPPAVAASPPPPVAVETPPPVAVQPPPPALPVIAAPPAPAVLSMPPGMSRPPAHDLARRHDLGSAAEEAAVLAAAATVVPRRITPVPAAPPPDLAATPMSTQAARVAHDAGSMSGFSADEEAFFSAGKKLEHAPPPPTDSFADLDDGYQPKSFWQKLVGPKPGPAKPGPRTPPRRK